MVDASRVGHATFRDEAIGDPAARIVVDVAVGPQRIQVEVIVDTGGTWIVLDPEIARLAEIIPATHDSHVKLVVRGEVWSGRLVRSTLVLLPEAGDELTIDGTFFVPELVPGDEWRHPSFLGWSGGLERIWFAVDPARRMFPFAALETV